MSRRFRPARQAAPPPPRAAPAATSQTLILLAIVGLLMAAMGGIVALQIFHAGDNTAVIASLVGALAPTIGALLVLLNQQATRAQVAATEQKVDATAQQVQELHVSVDGRLSQLLESSKSVAHLEGVEVGTQAAEAAAAVLAKTIRAEVAAAIAIALKDARLRETEAHEAGLIEGTALPQDPPGPVTEEEPPP